MPLLVAPAVVALAAWSWVHAQAPAEPDLLLEAASGDPLELAAYVDRVGDGALLEVLHQAAAGDEASTTSSPARQLAAIHASRWLHAPEEALPSLVTLASGSDPDLAPAAARALYELGNQLNRSDLERREASDTSVREALPDLLALANEASARADIRGAATHVHALLTELVRVDADEAPTE